VKADAELVKLLGAPPPAAISALPPETLGRLVEQIAAAKVQQHADMEKSVQKAIAGVPFAVRGLVRKALLG
jgi:hypothetical protein